MKRRLKKKNIFILITIVLLFIFLPKKINKIHNINYVINGFNVSENIKDNKTYIVVNDKYYYLLNEKHKKIVRNIELYSDEEYSCIYLTFNNDTNSNDLICEKDGINYLYSTSAINSETLNNNCNELVNNNKIKLLYNDKTTYEKKDLFKIYTNNIQKDYIFYLTSYKGLYAIDKSIEEINLFDLDVYEQDVKIFTKDKYIIANYNQKYEFNSLYVVDLKTKKISTIKFKYNISFNSNMFLYENNVYIKDLENDKTYIVDINNKTLKLTNISNNYQYIKEYKLLKQIDNTYYLEKDSKLYKSNYNSLDGITYLLDLNDKNNLQIGNSYICWILDTDITCYYKNSYQLLASSDEFKFNKTINYHIYEK